MANQLRLTTENPDEILNAGAYGAGAIMRLQTSATQAGVYADVSGVGSTPTIPIVTATFAYAGYDPAGTSTSWYRTRYENAGATRLSDWSDPFVVGQNQYTNLYDVRQDLEKQPTDLTADELLLDYIAEMTDYVRGHIGYDLLDPSLVLTFDGWSARANHRCLPVPGGVRTIATLKVAPMTGGTLATVTSTDYFLRPLSQDRAPGWPATEVWLSEWSPSYFAPGFSNIEITGTFGFGLVPPRIEGVTRRTVVRAYAARQAGGSDMTGSDSGQAIVSQFLSNRDREVLDSFSSIPVR